MQNLGKHKSTRQQYLDEMPLDNPIIPDRVRHICDCLCCADLCRHPISCIGSNCSIYSSFSHTIHVQITYITLHYLDVVRPHFLSATQKLQYMLTRSMYPSLACCKHLTSKPAFSISLEYGGTMAADLQMTRPPGSTCTQHMGIILTCSTSLTGATSAHITAADALTCTRQATSSHMPQHVIHYMLTSCRLLSHQLRHKCHAMVMQSCHI